MDVQDEQPPSMTFHQANGQRVQVSPDQVTLRDATGRLVTTIPRQEFSAVTRGGLDVIVTRWAADPVVLSLSTVAEARQVEVVLRQLLQSGASAARQRWWDRWREDRRAT